MSKGRANLGRGGKKTLIIVVEHRLSYYLIYK
jgi:hypothetical protein